MATAKDLLDKVSQLKSTSDTFEMKRTKGTISGAFIGMAGGLLLAYTRKYNLLTCAFIGALLGGVTAQVILPQSEDNLS
jgi:hypothetical protein